MFRNTSALLRGATIKGQYHTTFCASTSRWTHHKHRTPSGKATMTSIWPSNVLRVVAVLLWAVPTLRVAECVALTPTESAAKAGRCLYGNPRGEGRRSFLKTGGGLGKYFLQMEGRTGECLPCICSVSCAQLSSTLEPDNGLCNTRDECACESSLSMSRLVYRLKESAL